MQGTKELSDNKMDKRALQRGLLLEFQKDSQRSLLAVVERPDGKKNWMVTDQVLYERRTIFIQLINRSSLFIPGHTSFIIFLQTERYYGFCRDMTVLLLYRMVSCLR